jgi:hypothetical protein
MLSMAVGVILVLSILFRYVNSRRRFLNWSSGTYGTSSAGASTANSSMRKPQPSRQRGVYDRWLLVRFTIAFVFLR